MTVNPQTGMPADWVSDRQDLDEIFKNAKTYDNGEDWAIPGFFETDAEQEEFVAWVRVERNKEIA